MKSFTRDAIIKQISVSTKYLNENSNVLVIGGFGPVLNQIEKLNLNWTINTLDITLTTHLTI